MYHTDKLNQALFKEKLIPATFSSKDLQTDYTLDINCYLDTLTPLQKKIAYYILQFRNAPWVSLKNQSIALAIGCSVKTVTRATGQFLKDNFISKHQPNTYAPNNYSFNDDIKKVNFSFSHWFQSLSSSNQDLYISHGIRIDHKNRIIYSLRNVPQNKSSLILDSISRRSVLVSSRGGARITTEYKKTRDKKGRLMNSVQKQLILDNRHDPRVKDMLNNPDIKSHIITPTIQKIAQLLTLGEKEQFKLTAFTEETLYHVCGRVEEFLAHQKVGTIRNRMQWLIAFATHYCDDNNIKPDWKWYYDLCDIIGIDTHTERKPFVVPQLKKQGGIYKGKVSEWDRIKRIGSPKEQVDNWQLTVKSLQERLVEFTGPDPFHLKGLLQRNIENALQELTEAENLLKESNEKQIVSYQYSSRSMATCSA